MLFKHILLSDYRIYFVFLRQQEKLYERNLCFFIALVAGSALASTPLPLELR